ncbi:MAG: SH3 domain-containing protein [Devosiaceae bacterium]|nr:SH3 domain-containing protein [Devosiaceae bacterium]
MKLSKFFTIISTAMFAFMVTIAPVLSAPAVAKSAVNVRSGPSTSYAKIDTLYAGEKVTITQCQGGWCYVKHPGPDGWVSKNYLAPASGGNSSADDAALAAFLTIFGAVVQNITTPPAPVTPKVCFYNGTNYSGSSFCVNAGASNNKIVGFWNNRISSLKVTGGASVTLCRNWFYGGLCKSYGSNKANLGVIMSNKASSFQTF